ncbi:PREDICTED: uncharacterized protein LOC104728209 [Camelina sativa]|uniref:Uncharacterized protein LOC104728209 n=1 Tax=Camelina sativa TaxID=90675 RepID=A0ABM0USH0_CAMSA|nr:PREDICTED: uncharacterized protein LOC104728209 [Camelina sativa]
MSVVGGTERTVGADRIGDARVSGARVPAGGTPGGGVDLAQVVPPVAAEEQQPVAADVGVHSRYVSMLRVMNYISTERFLGGTDPTVIDVWRTRVERNIQSLRCHEEFWVDIGVHNLIGDAHLWWRSVAARRLQMEMSWADFVEEFKRKSFPREALDRLEVKFLQLSQGTRSVRELDLEFSRLLMYGGRAMESEVAQIRRFMRALRDDLRVHCRGRSYATRADLVETAAEID